MDKSRGLTKYENQFIKCGKLASKSRSKTTCTSWNVGRIIRRAFHHALRNDIRSEIANGALYDASGMPHSISSRKRGYRFHVYEKSTHGYTHGYK